MDTLLMMLGAVVLLMICIGMLLYMGGFLTVTIDGKKRGGKK